MAGLIDIYANKKEKGGKNCVVVFHIFAVQLWKAVETSELRAMFVI